MLSSMESAEGLAIDGAPKRGTPAAARPPQTEVPAAPPEEVASIPQGRRSPRGPPSPSHWRSSVPRRALCCSGHPLLGALWWVAAASAAATLRCLCRHHEGSRRCLLRIATPPAEGRLLDSSMCSQRKKQRSQTCLSLVVVVVVVVRTWCYTWVSVHPCARVQLIKWAIASALASSAGLSSRHPTTPVPSEGRFQASPGAKNSPNPKARKKIARPAHLTSHSFGGRGGAIFSISSALDALDPE